MLDGQNDMIVTVAPEIEVGISQGMEFRRSTKSPTGANGACALFGMMDDDDGGGDGKKPRIQCGANITGVAELDRAIDTAVEDLNHERMVDPLAKPRISAWSRRACANFADAPN
jgi:hypothetical protein